MFLGMCISDTNYTLRLWCPVLPQAKITLNIICPSFPHQKLFYQFHIAQYFDCETNPIGYLVTCVAENL